MDFIRCTIYLAIVGTGGFFIGRVIPKRWLKPDKGLFRSYPFEQGGSIYEKLGIRKWHKRLPDMSRILPFLVPAKNLTGNYEERLPEMIYETCVAEAVHLGVSVLGFRCLRMWPGIGGVVVTAIFILLLNLPFILIQRYNRPRLIRLQKKLESREKKKEGEVCAF